MPRQAEKATQYEFGPDVSPELVAKHDRLKRAHAAAAPRLFALTWRCNVADCAGEPHDRWTYKHARGPLHRSPQVIPAAVWKHYQVAYLEGGRGGGKTQAGAWNFAQDVLDHSSGPEDEWGVITRTFAHGRSVAIEGPSGLLRVLGGVGGKYVRDWSRTEGRVEMQSGAVIWLDSANDGGIRIQGKNLKGAWIDEPGLWSNSRWQRTWNESLAFALRKPPSHIIATGTPKRIGLSRVLHADPSVWKRRLLTIDNISNLAEDRVRWLLDRFANTPLGRQELEGIQLDEVAEALWTRAVLDLTRRWFHRTPFWTKTVVALDPSDGTTASDEEGIAVVSQSPQDGHLYVRHTDGVRMEPWEYLSYAVDLAVKFKASTLIIEANHGGKYLLGMAEQVLRHKGSPEGLAIQEVKATVGTGGKFTRAEPVAGLFHQGRAHLMGNHAELEDQLVSWTGKPDPDTGRMPPSPDRMDALVWACWPWIRDSLDESVGYTSTFVGYPTAASAKFEAVPNPGLWVPYATSDGSPAQVFTEADFEGPTSPWSNPVYPTRHDESSRHGKP